VQRLTEKVTEAPFEAKKARRVSRRADVLDVTRLRSYLR